MWLGLKSRSRHVICGLSCCWFLSGYTGFLLSSKTNISKFQFDKEPLSGCATSKSLNKTCKSFFLFIHFKIDLKNQSKLARVLFHSGCFLFHHTCNKHLDIIGIVTKTHSAYCDQGTAINTSS